MQANSDYSASVELRARTARQPVQALVFIATALVLAGCSSLVSNAASGFANNLALAVVNQPDPEIVRDGLPSYLLLLDSLIESDPDNPDLLGAAAEMYSAYGAVFADNPVRARILTERARAYGTRGLCITYDPSCGWQGLDYESFEASLLGTSEKDADSLYSYALSSLAYVRSHSDDWNALAELPQMEAMLKRLLEIDDGSRNANLFTYLGVLSTLRTPALGGEPEKGLEYFEQALALNNGDDLSIKLEIARSYARPLYDRELHDRLLTEVLAADPVASGFTLTNTLAQREATQLLETADDFF
ncbi:MAG: TRAP transporter TatT component family protein [Pseudomonadota bacterium]